MIDITSAREKLLEHERLRPSPGQFSPLWEHGQSWQHAFKVLEGIERGRDTQFEHLVDAAQGFEARREQLQQWSSSLRERVAWHGQLATTLQKHQRLWNVDQQGRSLAPPELFAHQAMLDLHMIACGTRCMFVELEFLEHRRCINGHIDEREWQKAWGQILEAFRSQTSHHKYWNNAEPTEKLRAERLEWCLRLQRIQATTAQSWGNSQNVDYAGLRADAATVDRMIDSLLPSRISQSSPFAVLVGVVGVVGVLIVLGLVFGGNGGMSQTAASATLVAGATKATTAIAKQEAGPTTVQAVAVLVGDLNTLNEEGKQLLGQGRCEEAIQRFQAAFDANPTAHEAYEPLNNMAFCLYELGRPAEAIAKWQQALAIEPNSPDANAGLGMALYVSGRRDDGIAYYRAALQLRAEYADEAWLRTVALWSERAINSSRELRAAGKP